MIYDEPKKAPEAEREKELDKKALEESTVDHAQEQSQQVIDVAIEQQKQAQQLQIFINQEVQRALQVHNLDVSRLALQAQGLKYIADTLGKDSNIDLLAGALLKEFQKSIFPAIEVKNA